MSEAQSSDAKEVKQDGEKPVETAMPITAESIFAITELAMIGLDSLRIQREKGRLDKLEEDPEANASLRHHYDILIDQAGPAAIKSFSRICAFSTEAGKKLSGQKQEASDGR